MSRAVVAALVVLLVVLGAPASGSAGGGADQPPVLEGRLEPGLDGYAVPGRPVPVRVTLSASELRTGRLSVHLAGRVSEVVDFEVTAGSSEEHWVLLDTPQSEALVVRASARLGDRDVELDEAPLRWDRSVHLLGVLDGLGGPGAGEAATGLLDQEIHLVDLEPALLDLGPEALGGLDGVAATVEDLRALPERHRDALLGWLGLGGTLYVDAPPGELEGWPEPLQPTAPTVREGAATVVATDGRLAEGRWSEVVLPAPNRSLHEDAEASASLSPPDPTSELFGADLGRDLPALSGLLAILAVYTILVGPVAYLALRRRAMARWMAIPVLAVLTTGVIYVGGDGGLEETTASVVDVVETGPGAAVATTRILVVTGSEGRGVVAPRGWTTRHDERLGFDSEVLQRRTPDGVEMELQTPAGGVGALSASGPVDFAGELEVSASAVDDGAVTGVVRNATDVTLSEVGVVAGRTAIIGVGTLEPGDSAEFELTETNRFRFGAAPFRELWAHGRRPGPVPAPVPGPATVPPPPPAPPPTVTTVPGGDEPPPTTTPPDGDEPPPSTTTVPGGEEPPPTVTTVPGAAVPPPPGGDIGPIVSETCDSNGNCTQCDANGNCFGFGGVPPAMECDANGNCFPGGMGACVGPGCAEGMARPEALTAAFWDRGTNALAPGLITAVGWTDQLEPVVDLGGGVELGESRTAVVGRAVPEVPGDRLVDAGSTRHALSVTTAEDGLLELLMRFDLPAAVGDRPVDAGRLRLDLPAFFERASILTPDAEVSVREAVGGAGGAPGRVGSIDAGDGVRGGPADPNRAPQRGRSEVEVPPEAVVGGHVFVRVALPLAQPEPGRELVLSEAPA